MKNKKLYLVFIIAIIVDFAIFGYLIYNNYQFQQQIANLKNDILKIESNISLQNLQMKEVNEKVSNIIEKENNEIITEEEKSKQFYEKLTKEAKLKHPTWVEDDYYFDNSNIEGKTPITKEKAIEVWNEYRKNIILNNLDIYKIRDIKVKKVKPTNRLTAGTDFNIKTADFEREAYVIYCSDDGDLTYIIGYVDMYTGKVIGGFYGGV